MELLRLSYEVERLCDIIEERSRLVSVLKIAPSKNDTMALKKQLNETLDLLQEAVKTITPEDQSSLNDCITKYNEALSEIPDDSVNKSLYVFEKRPSPESGASLSSQESKRVRFKDDLVEYEEQKQLEPAFKPYTDKLNEEDTLEQDKSDLFGEHGKATSQESSYNIAPQLSNQEIFIQQQQQLLEQDSHLEDLSQSVHRAHDISLDINHEMTDQNDGVLRDLESLVDNSGRNLDRAKQRLEIFERSARENGPCLLIVLLTLILILLLAI